MEERLRLTRRRLLRAAGIIFLAEACRPLGSSESTSKPELPGIADLDFPLSGDMYLLRGPHYITDNEGIRYAIDVYSPDRNAKIVAAKYGIVTVAGEITPTGPNDTLRSIVEIELKGDKPENSGYSLQYIHVGNIRVKVGQEVHRGDVLGEQSMEIPAPRRDEKGQIILPTPSTSRTHLHFGIKRYGKPIRIDGISIGGWIIREGRNPGEGTMSKEDKYAIENYKVVANPNYLCGFSKSTNAPCQGDTNLLLYPKRLAPGNP